MKRRRGKKSEIWEKEREHSMNIKKSSNKKGKDKFKRCGQDENRVNMLITLKKTNKAKENVKENVF